MDSPFETQQVPPPGPWQTLRVMGSLEVLPHTADVGFRAWGESLADQFETADRAMFSLEYDPSTVPLDREVPVEVEGDDAEAALYQWLSELIWHHDAKGFVPGQFCVDAVGRPPGGDGLNVVGSAVGAQLR